jgi:hypothetical protein
LRITTNEEVCADFSACYFMLVACLTYSLTLKIEAAGSFEMSVNYHWTTCHHIPEDSISGKFAKKKMAMKFNSPFYRVIPYKINQFKSF